MPERTRKTTAKQPPTPNYQNKRRNGPNRDQKINTQN